VLLPFAFVDSFIRLADNYPVISTIANDYVYALVPFNVLTSWVFFLLQRISESCLDPFDGKPTDVPIAALTRLIEIDLLQMLHDSDIPEPCSPKRGVLQ
jgi:ion channel-forming bestrophin family protein